MNQLFGALAHTSAKAPDRQFPTLPNQALSLGPHDLRTHNFILLELYISFPQPRGWGGDNSDFRLGLEKTLPHLKHHLAFFRCNRNRRLIVKTAVYKIVRRGQEWAIHHDGEVEGNYATKEGAFEAINRSRQQFDQRWLRRFDPHSGKQFR